MRNLMPCWWVPSKPKYTNTNTQNTQIQFQSKVHIVPPCAIFLKKVMVRGPKSVLWHGSEYALCALCEIWHFWLLFFTPPYFPNPAVVIDQDWLNVIDKTTLQVAFLATGDMYRAENLRRAALKLTKDSLPWIQSRSYRMEELKKLDKDLLLQLL